MADADKAAGAIGDLISETLRLGRSGEALMAVATNVLTVSTSIARVLEVDGTRDLWPELNSMMEMATAMAEAVESTGNVIDTRFQLAMERIEAAVS